MKRTTLRKRLSLLLALWFAVCATVLGALALAGLARIRDDVRSEQDLLARSAARALDRALSRTLRELDRVGGALSGSDEEARADLRAFRLRSAFHRSIALTDADLQPLAVDPPGAPAPALRDPPRAAEVTGLLDAASPSIALVHPFRRGGRTRYLVATMDLADAFLTELLRESAGGRPVDVAVVDATGRILATSDGTSVGRAVESLPAAPADGSPRSARLDSCPLGDEAHRGRPSLTTVAALELAPWTVVVAQPRATALAGYDRLQRGVLLAGILLLLAGGALAAVLSRSVVGPIRALSDRAARLRAGDLTTPIEAAGDEEVETLAETLEAARSRLGDTLAQLEELNRDLEQRVAERTERLRIQGRQRRRLVRRLLNASEEERRRIARELHDEISQLLTVIQLSIDRLGANPPEAERLRELVRRGQDEIHRIIHDLRPSLLDDLGLAAAIESHVESRLRSEGIEVHLEIEPDLPARREVDTTIFRIYQEIATNVLRHSRADSVSIELYEADGKRVLAVEDDGVGFAPDDPVEGAGLVGMRERASLVNGTIRIDSEPDLGAHIVVEVPIEP